MTTIQELSSVTRTDYENLKDLMTQLSPRLSLCEDTLDIVIEEGSTHLFVIREDDMIIGTATLCVYSALSGRKGIIEDVVIDERFRGRNLGRMLLEYVLKSAEQYSPIDIHLTSKPARTAANRLYQSLGFERKDTNAYVLKL